MSLDAKTLALARLRVQLARLGNNWSDDRAALRVAGRRLEVEIETAPVSRQGGQQLVPLEIALVVDDHASERFRWGVVGSGSDLDAALQSAIDEWEQLAAVPVLEALLDAPAAGGWQTGKWHCFPGKAGLRGRAPAALRANSPLFQQLAESLRRYVGDWTSPTRFDLRSLCVIACWAEGKLELQAAVDGLLDTRLAEKLMRLEWPQGADAWLYKQLFVVRGDDSA